jgi:hypothetical protein
MEEEPARGRLVEVYGAVPNRAKAKRRKASVPVGEPACGGEAQYPSDGTRIGDGIGTKFCAFTRGDLSASAEEAVAIENERTRW